MTDYIIIIQPLAFIVGIATRCSAYYQVLKTTLHKTKMNCADLTVKKKLGLKALQKKKN